MEQVEVQAEDEVREVPNDTPAIPELLHGEQCCPGCRIMIEHVVEITSDLSRALVMVTTELREKGVGGVLREMLTGGKKVKRGRGKQDGEQDGDDGNNG